MALAEAVTGWKEAVSQCQNDNYFITEQALLSMLYEPVGIVSEGSQTNNQKEEKNDTGTSNTELYGKKWEHFKP